jgi:tetratricopeptide (TPR) repeat protein
MSTPPGRPPGTPRPNTPPPLPPVPSAARPPARGPGRGDSDASKTTFDVKGVRSPLVGRADQLAVLREVVKRAVDFQAPQLVTVVGNQGTGKSRLIAELVAGLKPPVRVITGRARQGGERNSAIASLVRDRFGLAAGDGGDAQKDKFASDVRAVMGTDQVVEVLHFLGGYVGLDFPPSPFLRVLAESPRQKEDIARTVLRRFIEVDAAKSPIVIVLDDMQWADDDTLKIVSDLASGLGGSPVVIIAATRPEMLVRTPGWGGGAVDHERIDLRNLEPDEAEAMFRNLLLRCGTVLDDIAQAAVEMTGGNPSFIEQLVRLFLANGTIDATGPLWKLDPDKAAATELPISIEEAIEARIAALERDEREVLEKAAVFGNVFWTSAVVALTRQEAVRDERPPTPLDYEWGEGEQVRRRVSDLIHALADRDYLLPLDAADSTIPGDIEVVFKHNLERELIVKSTEASRLSCYYLAAAQWLEARISGRSEEQLEFLAGLYERGGDRRRAAKCYLAGGDRARNRYAAEEARVLYERGLAMLGDDDAPSRMDALHNLGDVLDQGGRIDDALARFADMLHLAWRLDNFAKAGAAYSRIARVLRRRGRYDSAMENLRRAHELFTRGRDDRGIASTLDDMGRVHWLRGAYGQALDYHRQALTIRRGLGDRRSIALSLANIGRVHHDSGNFKAAIAQLREALDLRRDIGDLLGVVQSLCDLGGVYAEDGNHELALDLLGEASNIAGEIGDKFALAEVMSRAGEVKAAVGRGAEGIADMTRAKALATELGDKVALAVAQRRLAEVRLVLGEIEVAEQEGREALAIGEALGSRVHIGCAYRVLGEVAAGRHDAAAAEERFRKAVDILSAVKNEVELARAYRAFALFRERTGNTAEAHKLRTRADEIFGRLRGAAATE